jgi:hypothetical protein
MAIAVLQAFRAHASATCTAATWSLVPLLSWAQLQMPGQQSSVAASS